MSEIAAEEKENVSLAGYHDLAGRPGFKMALQVKDGEWYLYLTHFWQTGWSILNITEPTRPFLENYIDGPDNTQTKQIQVADGKMITSLERPGKGSGPVDGEKFDPNEPYETGVYIWDVKSDPVDPQLLSHYETGGRGTHRNYYNGGNYVYLTASPEGYEPTIDDKATKPMKNFHLRVLDISNSSNPEEVGKWMWPGQDPADNHEPKNRYFHGPAYVKGDRAHLSYGRVGAVTLDVSNPEDPELIWKLGFGEGLGGYNGVHSFIPIPGTDLAAVCSEASFENSPLDHENGDPLQYVFLLDISDERPPDFVRRNHKGPRAISSLPLPTPEDHLPYDTYYEKPARFGPHNLHHPRETEERLQSSNYLPIAYFNAGLRIFDISNPVAPREAGYYVPEKPPKRLGVGRPRGELETQFEDVVVDSRGYIYCTDPNRGLFILKSELLEGEV